MAGTLLSRSISLSRPAAEKIQIISVRVFDVLTALREYSSTPPNVAHIRYSEYDRLIDYRARCACNGAVWEG